MPQKPAALRHPESQRMRDAGTMSAGRRRDQRVRRAVAIGVLVAQERDEIAHRREADADHRDPVASYQIS